MTALLLAVGGFVAMEAVSYAMHRWVMHGIGFGWHRSHHQPRRGRWEANDRFPLIFAALGVGLFAIGSGPWPWAWWVAVGVTAYGFAYLVVHELVIHRRLRLPLPSNRYLAWLRDAHGDHHRGGGEPYGMLLPLVRRPGPGGTDDDVLDRSVGPPTAESGAPATRRDRRASRARL